MFDSLPNTDQLPICSDDNEFRMEEEMARLVAEKENIEAEKKNLARQLERLQNAFVWSSWVKFSVVIL